METECTQRTFPFQPLGNREVVGRFDGGKITSDAGAVAANLRERTRRLLERHPVWVTTLSHRFPTGEEAPFTRGGTT